MTLQEVRKSYERGLKPLVVLDQIQNYGNVLVILTSIGKGSLDQYHCHRYFSIGDEWTVSIDGQRVPLAAVWSWLNDPCAISTQPDWYVSPKLETV